MQRHMEQLQDRQQEMLQNAEEGIEIMERIQERLEQGQSR